MPGTATYIKGSGLLRIVKKSLVSESTCSGEKPESDRYAAVIFGLVSPSSSPELHGYIGALFNYMLK